MGIKHSITKSFKQTFNHKNKKQLFIQHCWHANHKTYVEERYELWSIRDFVYWSVNTVVYLENAKRRLKRPRRSSSGRCWAPSELSRRFRIFTSPLVWTFLRVSKRNVQLTDLQFDSDLQAQRDAILEWRSTSAAQSCERSPSSDSCQHIVFTLPELFWKIKNKYKKQVNIFKIRIFWSVHLTSTLIHFMYL